ncbi:MAG: pyrroline-5-carboxylate reductase [Verrucomicrobia bacterium]|nr:pyrroline-5-carboxylate reductase [Verrucomicrobiota bacterium]
MSAAKFAFLGAGNMASAMVDGLLAKGGIGPGDLVCLGGSGRTAVDLAARSGIKLAGSLPELVGETDVLVVAFKPQQLAAADPRLAELTAGKLVISVLAGKRLARLAQTFPRARAIVWAMPNTPARIGAGITAWCSLAPLASHDRASVDLLLGALGAAIEIDEALMDVAAAVSASGPAFLFEFVAALRDGGVAGGLPADTARTLAIETVLGAARLLARSGVDPEELRRQVTSPKGMTLAGLNRMEARDFRGTLRETVLAAKARSEEMSKDT